MDYNCKNYEADGGNAWVIGGELRFEGDGHLTPGIKNIPSGDATAAAIVTALKDAGLMVGDAFSLTYSAVTTDTGHANRMYNTNKISAVAIDETAKTITITLSAKVSALKDFDGGHGWGVHKWLGIGLVTGINYPTVEVKYNGTALTAEDASEASGCGCSGTGVFVRWVAADLVANGDNTQKSVDTFSLWSSGYAKTNYKLVIVQPA